MGRLIDGKWETRDLGPDEQGRYVRRAAAFRGRISTDGSTPFEAERGRYHLFVSYACGWSHRTLIARQLKKLTDVVSISSVENFMGDEGWTFAGDGEPITGARRFYEIYTKAQADYTGRASVPVLWDRKTETIVSNESLDIVEMFDRELDAWSDSSVRFFPESSKQDILAAIQANYSTVNNGVYRAGFAGKQEAHEEAITGLFRRLDELEALLSTQRYLCGSELTAADWCLFSTLFRFDPVYYVHFKCNLKRLVDYEHLWAYTRDLYQQPGVAETCRLDDIKEHYYTSHESISPRRLIPMGPIMDYAAPHDRDRL